MKIEVDEKIMADHATLRFVTVPGFWMRLVIIAE
jgi:hypothetical protein